jgi:hypothetical protein
MSESAQGAYTVKSVEQPRPTPQLDDRNDPPTVSDDSDDSDPNFVDPIKKQIGETVVLTNGRDYVSPKVRVVPSTYHGASENEKQLYISQGKTGGISISLESLKHIVAWAEKEK